MMRSLKLSEEERKGVKIRLGGKELGKGSESQAVGRVVSEKPAHPDAICLSLGQIWCPIKGIDCKEAGDNRFVFNFKQESRKRKAIEDGPWMFDKDLVVVEDYDPCKRIEDYDFNDIPIWVRIFSLPLGMMNETAAEEIGNIIGKFVEVDAGADGRAIGKFLRVKIRMNIEKPIMRGFTLDDEDGKEPQKRKKNMSIDGKEGEEEEGLWCRFEYEFLPDFCYTCGFIGHLAKDCIVKPQKRENQQFGPWLRADLGKKRFVNEEERSWKGRGGSGGGSRQYEFSRSGRRSGSGNGSDSLSWRKDGVREANGKGGRAEGEEEVTSPAKVLIHNSASAGKPRKLNMNEANAQPSVTCDNTSQEKMLALVTPSTEKVVTKEKGQAVQQRASAEGKDGAGGNQNPKKGGTFHRIPRKEDRKRGAGQNNEPVLGKKRSLEVKGSGVEDDAKRGKVVAKGVETGAGNEVAANNNNDDKISAGLSEQPRRKQ